MLSPQKNGNTITHIIIVPFPPVVEFNVPMSAKPEKEQTKLTYYQHVTPLLSSWYYMLVVSQLRAPSSRFQQSLAQKAIVVKFKIASDK